MFQKTHAPPILRDDRCVHCGTPAVPGIHDHIEFAPLALPLCWHCAQQYIPTDFITHSTQHLAPVVHQATQTSSSATALDQHHKIAA